MYCGMKPNRTDELKRVVVVFCCVLNGCEWLVLFSLQTILEHTASQLVQVNNILRKNLCIRTANILDFNIFVVSCENLVG